MADIDLCDIAVFMNDFYFVCAEVLLRDLPGAL
jgi:hypothetical protein